jgi:hypothetical protein
MQSGSALTPSSFPLAPPVPSRGPCRLRTVCARRHRVLTESRSPCPCCPTRMARRAILYCRLPARGYARMSGPKVAPIRAAAAWARRRVCDAPLRSWRRRCANPAQPLGLGNFGGGVCSFPGRWSLRRLAIRRAWAAVCPSISAPASACWSGTHRLCALGNRGAPSLVAAKCAVGHVSKASRHRTDTARSCPRPDDVLWRACDRPWQVVHVATAPEMREMRI